MKTTVKFLLIATIPTLFLSGCCGKFQSPYTCSESEHSTCSTPHYTPPVQYVQPAQTVQYVQPAQTVQYKTVRVPRRGRNNCVAYSGYDNTCVAW